MSREIVCDDQGNRIHQKHGAYGNEMPVNALLRQSVCSLSLLLFVNLCNLSLAEPIKNFQLFSGTIKVTDISGKPVSNAVVYGFCKDLLLFWPRLHQDHFVWDPHYYTKSDINGFVFLQIPHGKWTFCAIGVTNSNEILCTAITSEVNQPFSLTLKPEIQLKSSYGFRPRSSPDSDCLFSKFFFRHIDIPFYIQVPIAPQKEYAFQSNQNCPFNIWGQGETEDKQTSLILNCGRLKEGRKRHESLNQIKFKENETASDFNLSWDVSYNMGLAGKIKVSPIQKIAISNGEYSIGYERNIEGLWLVFVPRQVLFSGTEEIVFSLNDTVKPSFWTLNWENDAYVQMFLIDDNGFHVKRILDINKKPFAYEVCIKQNGKTTSAKPSAGDVQIRLKNFVLNGGELWNFSLPLPALQEKWYSKTAFIERRTKHYKVRVPIDLLNYADNLLNRLELFSRTIEKVSGRKKHTAVTQIILNVISRSYATFDGSKVYMGTHILFHDNPMVPHTFPHELVHNYNIHHSGLQEIIVELSRSGSNNIFYGQASLWIFIDRMNERNAKEIWYSDSSLYFWAFSQGGLRFLHNVSRFEPELLKRGGEKGFLRGEIITAMFSVFLERDMYDIAFKYGFSKDKIRYDKALIFVRSQLLPYGFSW